MDSSVNIAADTIVPVNSIHIQDSIPGMDTISPADSVPSFDTVPTPDIIPSLETIPKPEIVTIVDTGPSVEGMITPDRITPKAAVRYLEIAESSDTLVPADTLGGPFFKESQLVGGTGTLSDIPGHPLRNEGNVPDWYFFTLMGLLVFIAWARTIYGNVIMKILQASVNFSVTQRMFLDNSLLQKQLDNVLYVLYLISFGFYLLLIQNKFGFFPYGFTGVKLFMFNVAFLLLVFLGRIILISITGKIFGQTELLNEYRYNIFVFNKLTGLIIIPFLIFMIYSGGFLKNFMEWISISMIGIIVLLRIYRGVEFSIRRDIFILYLFLYLCGLEIIPIMVLFKWIVSIV